MNTAEIIEAFLYHMDEQGIDVRGIVLAPGDLAKIIEPLSGPGDQESVERCASVRVQGTFIVDDNNEVWNGTENTTH